MERIKLLDCTLRDGGYINEWDFGFETIRNIIKKLVEAKTDYVEVGFLRNDVYDKDKAVFNNCSQIAPILPKQRGNTKFTVMALHNKYDISRLEPFDGKTVDAMRVTFHDYDIDEGLSFIKKAMEKGYKIFCNPINIMGYSDEQLLKLIGKVNKIKPYAFSIVDTFGSMMKPDLVRLYSILEHNLDKDIVIGLHLHENLALSYSLAQDFITMCSVERQAVVDASLLGMGRVPGNLCLELIMDYMKRYQGRKYDTNPILDVIDDYIAPLKEVEPWGYSTAYALSAKFNLHRNYAEFLLGKGNLRAKQINQLLASVEQHKKTAYDKDYIEQLYLEYQNIVVEDEETLKQLQKQMAGKNILVIAPGPSVAEYKEEIETRMEEENLVVVCANFSSEIIASNYRFFSNAQRYEDYRDGGQDDDCIITSNLIHAGGTNPMVVNYADLAFDGDDVFDNCVIMLLRLLARLECKKVYLAGFDGYVQGRRNYVKRYMRSKHEKNESENEVIRQHLERLYGKLNIEFLTPSLYRQ